MTTQLFSAWARFWSFPWTPDILPIDVYWTKWAKSQMPPSPLIPWSSSSTLQAFNLWLLLGLITGQAFLFILPCICPSKPRKLEFASLARKTPLWFWQIGRQMTACTSPLVGQWALGRSFGIKNRCPEACQGSGLPWRPWWQWSSGTTHARRVAGECRAPRRPYLSSEFCAPRILGSSLVGVVCWLGNWICVPSG